MRSGKMSFSKTMMLEPGDVVISVGKIYKAITGSSGVPSENPAALRLALYCGRRRSGKRGSGS